MASIAPASPSRATLPVAALLAALLAITFRDGLAAMANWWNEPEYSHGWLVPFLALYLLAVRARDLRPEAVRASWVGTLLVAAGMLAFLFGELSALYVIVQYAFVLTLWGVMVAVTGWRSLPVTGIALVFLLFMVPLPRFIQWNLSNELQLLSSQMGTGLLRLFTIPVYLEGNVIDLGRYRLQVVEACSGLRYLFPLMSFGLLCAAMFRGPLWQRALIFVSSVPITIVMNSVRIAITGVLVNAYGSGMADGFLHYFEGWVIFSACLVLMFLEMWALARVSGRTLADALDVTVPRPADLRRLIPRGGSGAPLAGALVLLAAGCAASFAVADREELIPDRAPLRTFPLALGAWSGTELALSEQELAELKLTDYIVARYTAPVEPAGVELYVAYYDSQRKGASVHSPKACLPGGGWQIESQAVRQVPGLGPAGEGLAVNRAVISAGEQRLLVYYWFMQRGRNLTNEYLVKWYIFSDSITRRRTDGALVRLVTVVPDPAGLDAADARLTRFLAAAEPRLYYHVPQ